MSFRFKTKFRFKGHDCASAEQLPAKVRDAYAPAVAEMPILHSGARLAAKLNAKIIVNGVEFSNPGEMSVAERQLYHEALEAFLPNDVTVSVAKPARFGRKKIVLMFVVLGALATVGYLWLHGFFG
jgi:hypothetical protein